MNFDIQLMQSLVVCCFPLISTDKSSIGDTMSQGSPEEQMENEKVEMKSPVRKKMSGWLLTGASSSHSPLYRLLLSTLIGHLLPVREPNTVLFESVVA